MEKLGIGSPALPFCDVRWYGHRGTPHLRGEAIPLFHRKIARHAVRCLGKVHRFLPRHEITVVPNCHQSLRNNGGSSLLPCCPLPAACCLLPAARCLLPAARCLLPAACCPLPAVRCLL